MRIRRTKLATTTVALLIAASLTLPATAPAAEGVASGYVIPREPPRADLITFGPLDEVGEAAVIGGPGAVLPAGHVLVVNLDTSHLAFVQAAPDGSFATRVFAPPGSNIMVRHAPDDPAIHHILTRAGQGGAPVGLTVFRSTILHRDYPQRVNRPGLIAFAAAGATGVNDAPPTSIDAGWSLRGTVGPVQNLRPGDSIEVKATLRLYSNGIDRSDASVLQRIRLEIGSRPWAMIYDADGTPLAHVNQPGSSRLTPTGLPILDGRRPTVGVDTRFDVGPWRFAGDNAVETDVVVTLSPPDVAPPGTYRPVLDVRLDGVPAHTGAVAGALMFHQGWSAFTYGPEGAALPPIEIQPGAAADPSTGPLFPTGSKTSAGVAGNDEARRLIWYLLMDDASLGTHGAGAREDATIFQPASFVATQGAPYVLAPTDPYTGERVTYRMEPQLPMIGYGRGASPDTPVIPFDLPGGELCVAIRAPNGHERDLGCDTFTQSVTGDRSTRGDGTDLNRGSIEVSDIYGLRTGRDRFTVSFDTFGHHVVEMRGWVEDVWGNRYEGGGTYDVWVANPLDLDPGILPGTPLAAGDAVNPAVRVQPHVPAEVTMSVRHFPYSDRAQVRTYVREGRANAYGYFAPPEPALTLDVPGEYRVDLTARYRDPATGHMWMGALTWGGIVMTPPEDATLVAHGRRGLDTFPRVPRDASGKPLDWFPLCELDTPEDLTPHAWNPYLNGDVLWSRDDLGVSPDRCIGDALVLGASVEDTSGQVREAITRRFHRRERSERELEIFADRADAGELPLFSTTTSGRAPTLDPAKVDQVAYAYLSSQRPGVRVRETVSEDSQHSYWRLNDLYDGQPGVGVAGDLPNDVKFQYVGAVYRDLVTGRSEYVGHGSAWVHTRLDDTMGNRVMPPFAGPGNGGWLTCGGPLMKLRGEDVHQFVLPTAVRPGAVLEVGDRFDFAGHVLPTLDSRIDVTVTGPSGQTHTVSGRANAVGYFHDPADAFVVDEPGRWTAKVRVWHDGAIGNGQFVNCNPDDAFNKDRPCPSGDVLGSTDGRYNFYVAPNALQPLAITAPAPGPLTFARRVQPIEISGSVPDGMDDPILDYTITMPGFILEQGTGTITGDRWSFRFRPERLNEDFPNLDLTGLHVQEQAGLSDTFAFGVLLSGRRDGQSVHHAATLTIQGDLVQTGM